jgi:hypothetical protein
MTFQIGILGQTQLITPITKASGRQREIDRKRRKRVSKKVDFTSQWPMVWNACKGGWMGDARRNVVLRERDRVPLSHFFCPVQFPSP